MNGETLNQIIAVLRVKDMTPRELLITCKEGYGMDTFAFTEAITALEKTGVVRRESIINKDHSGSTVYRLDTVRTEVKPI